MRVLSLIISGQVFFFGEQPALGEDLGVVVGRYIFFFFQAEDGIRDLTVTGVQTCALPICGGARLAPAVPDHRPAVHELPLADTGARALGAPHAGGRCPDGEARERWPADRNRDRKSTRLNSSHSQISYAVFCLKKKKKKRPD